MVAYLPMNVSRNDFTGTSFRYLSERGRVRLDLLLLNGRPIAGNLWLRLSKAAYYFYLPGFDPARASERPVLVCSCCITALSSQSVPANGWWIYCKAHNHTNVEWSNDIRRSMTLAILQSVTFVLWLSSCWKVESRLSRYLVR
jgi:hypothetical protein